MSLHKTEIFWMYVWLSVCVHLCVCVWVGRCSEINYIDTCDISIANRAYSESSIVDWGSTLLRRAHKILCWRRRDFYWTSVQMVNHSYVGRFSIKVRLYILYLYIFVYFLIKHINIVSMLTNKHQRPQYLNWFLYGDSVQVATKLHGRAFHNSVNINIT